MLNYQRKQEVFFSFIIWLVLIPYLVADLLMIFIGSQQVGQDFGSVITPSCMVVYRWWD